MFRIFPSSLQLLVLVLLSVGAAAQEPGVEQRFHQGTEAMRQGHLDKAAAEFLAVTRLSPQFAEAYFNLGLILQQQGKYEDAISTLKHALSLKPKLRGANLFLGLAEYRLNHLEMAVAALRREAELNPSDANVWMWLGVSEVAAGKPDDAAAALDKAAKLAPDNVDILYHRGRAHMLVSKQSFEQMFKANPNSWRVRQVLAQADAEADRHQDAIAEYEAAIKLVPEEPGLHEELGSQYWNLGQLEAAEAQFQRELEIDPNNTLALYKLGSLRVERAKPSEGKPLIEAALRQNPALRDAYYYLGRAEMQLGNNEAALEDLKRAVASDSDPEIIQQGYYQLAQLYRRMHRSQESQEALARFQKLKQEVTEHQQQLFETKRKTQQEQGVADPPVPSNDPK